MRINAAEKVTLFTIGRYVDMCLHIHRCHISANIILFCVQGKNASTKDKAASAIYAAQLDKEIKNVAIQVRVVQGHEPRHFLKIFKGKLLTYINGDSSDSTKLFRIRGTCTEDVRADELPALASSLASDDIFIVKTANVVYVWKGIVSIKMSSSRRLIAKMYSICAIISFEYSNTGWL